MEVKKWRAVAVPLTAVLAVGLSACSGDPKTTSESTSAESSSVTPNDDCSSMNGLTDFRPIGGNKDGALNAVNSGECVEAYDPQNLQSVGKVATDAAFAIVCFQASKPAAFNIVSGNIEGNVNLSSELAQRVWQGEFPEIPTC